jgi:hypothetical protein
VGLAVVQVVEGKGATVVSEVVLAAAGLVVVDVVVDLDVVVDDDPVVTLRSVVGTAIVEVVG